MDTKYWLIAVLSVSVLFGCERKPEDLEVWRNAEGGYEKMAEWAQSTEEPDAVRVRAVQILIEENQPNALQPLFEGISDPAMKKKLVDGALPTVQTMWDKRDWPKIGEGSEGLVKVAGRSESEAAKDAAYFLQPHAEGASKDALEAILAEWMSQDQDIRDQLGVTTIAQVAPRAGSEGIQMMLKWLETTKQPSVVVDKIMAANSEDKNDKVTAALADAVRKRCEAEHPNLKPQTEVAMLKVNHENMVPYLERAILDENSSKKLVDGAMDAYVRTRKGRSAGFFGKLVAEKTGVLRWVSATRLIEIRGKAGVLPAANALPLEADTYAEPEDDSFKKESEIFCNFVNSELRPQDVDPVPIVKQMLASKRWPVKVLGVQCVKTTGAKELKGELEAMKKDKTPLPGWGESKTLGKLAKEIAAEM